MKRTFAAATLLLTIGTASSAAIIAQEDFSYADGTLPGNGAAGSGWDTGWSATNGTGNITLSGGEVTGSTSGQRAVRSLTDSQGTNGTTIYVGVDYAFGTHYSALELQEGGSTRLRLQTNTSFTGTGGEIHSMQREENGTGVGIFHFTPVSTGVNRYVFEIVYGAGDIDTATLYENGVELGSITSDSDGFDLNRVSLGAFGGGGSLGTVDNLIIATTFAEAVPEPGSLALLGLGGLLIARRRRD